MSVILITGGNKGLGYETARRLIGEGHTVYIGARSAERGEKAASELGGRLVQLDVTDDHSVETALETIREQEGRLDVLINNAGIWDVRPSRHAVKLPHLTRSGGCRFRRRSDLGPSSKSRVAVSLHKIRILAMYAKSRPGAARQL